MSSASITGEDCFATLAELWCSPQDVEQTELRERAEQLAEALSERHPEVAAALGRFLADPLAEEDYVELFELDPKCALYLGSHTYEEPKTCAQSGVSDRNGYMIELQGIYRHFGLAPDPTELPDYLPLMLECVALTDGRADPVRSKLICDFILPFLPPMRGRLEELQSSYASLLDATERLLQHEVEAQPTGDNRV